MHITKPWRRGALGLLVAGGAMVASAGPAFAHVDAEATSGGDGLTKIEFSFTHGCGASPTTLLRIQLPPGTTDVTPTDAAGWTPKVTASELAWTGGPAPDGTKTTFEATMRVLGAKGDTVYFPTIQGCTVGENAWIDKDPDAEGEHAAPRIVLGETVTVGDNDKDPVTTGPTATAAPAAPTTVSAQATSIAPGTTVAATPSSSSAVPILVGVIVVVVLIAGVGFVVARGRARPPS